VFDTECIVFIINLNSNSKLERQRYKSIYDLRITIDDFRLAVGKERLSALKSRSKSLTFKVQGVQGSRI
jgi:hypothetical protein